MLVIVGSGSSANFQADRLYKSNDTYQYKCGCGGVKAHKKGRGLASGCCPSLKNAWAFNKTLYVATKASRIPGNLNFVGETAFWRGIFCLEYPSRRSEKVNCHFLNYRLSFRKLQIFISQTTDFHFVNYRFSFRFVSFRFAPFRLANYSKPARRQEGRKRGKIFPDKSIYEGF